MLPIPHPRICKTLMVTSKKFKKSKNFMLSSYSKYFCLKLSDMWPLLDFKERHTRTKGGKKKKKITELLYIAALKILFSQCQKAVFLHSSFALNPTAVVICDAKLTKNGG